MIGRKQIAYKNRQSMSLYVCVCVSVYKKNMLLSRQFITCCAMPCRVKENETFSVLNL